MRYEEANDFVTIQKPHTVSVYYSIATLQFSLWLHRSIEHRFHGRIYEKNHPVWKCQHSLPQCLCWCWHLACYPAGLGGGVTIVKHIKDDSDAIVQGELNYLIKTWFHNFYCHRPFSLQNGEVRHVLSFSLALLCSATACILTTLDAVSKRHHPPPT